MLFLYGTTAQEKLEPVEEQRMALTHTFTINRLRNLTTQRLHTKMDDIYRDLETLIGEQGIMTHMIPRIMDAVEPWLRAHPQLQDSSWWDGEFRQCKGAPIDLVLPSTTERAKMLGQYAAMPNPLIGKQVVAVIA